MENRFKQMPRSPHDLCNIFIRINVCMQIYLCTCIYACVSIYIYIYVYIYIHRNESIHMYVWILNINRGKLWHHQVCMMTTAIAAVYRVLCPVYTIHWREKSQPKDFKRPNESMRTWGQAVQPIYLLIILWVLGVIQANPRSSTTTKPRPYFT